jgi:hypothetical protein
MWWLIKGLFQLKCGKDFWVLTLSLKIKEIKKKGYCKLKNPPYNQTFHLRTKDPNEE